MRSDSHVINKFDNTFSVNVKERTCLIVALESVSSTCFLTKAFSVRARRDCHKNYTRFSIKGVNQTGKQKEAKGGEGGRKWYSGMARSMAVLMITMTKYPQ